MKKMMKAAMVVAMVAISASASAQFSANVGYVNSTQKAEQGNISVSTSVPGITAGVGYDMNIQGGFGLAWGLNYTFAWKNELLGVEVKSKDHYLDIPVRATFTYPISDSFKVFGFAGPKFVCAIAGSDKSEVEHYGGDGGLNRFDIKLGLGAGVNFSNILLKVGYDWGLLNQIKDAPDDVSAHIHQFYVTVGYAF